VGLHCKQSPPQAESVFIMSSALNFSNLVLKERDCATMIDQALVPDAQSKSLWSFFPTRALSPHTLRSLRIGGPVRCCYPGWARTSTPTSPYGWDSALQRSSAACAVAARGSSRSKLYSVRWPCAVRLGAGAGAGAVVSTGSAIASKGRGLRMSDRTSHQWGKNLAKPLSPIKSKS